MLLLVVTSSFGACSESRPRPDDERDIELLVLRCPLTLFTAALGLQASWEVVQIVRSPGPPTGLASGLRARSLGSDGRVVGDRGIVDRRAGPGAPPRHVHPGPVRTHPEGIGGIGAIRRAVVPGQPELADGGSARR